MRSKARIWIAGAVIVATVAAFAGPASAGAGKKGKAYDPLPDLPGNVVSLGFEATSTSEFGDGVTLAASPKRHRFSKINVVMSSWGCETGGGVTCTTTPNSFFTHPITISIYAADNTGAPGALILRKTQIFKILYRPSADPLCGTGWSPDGGTTCYNGLAQIITFKKMGNGRIPTDRNIVWTVAYNTTHYGANPLGEGAACYTDGNGCGYDSLNVGAESFPGAPFVGTDLDNDGAVLSSTWSGAYCDGGAGGTGTLRVDTAPGCWTDYRPLAEIFTRK